MKKLVIFDFDGCLVHTLDAWMASAHEALTKRGISVDNKEVVEHIFKHDDGPASLGVQDLTVFWTEYIAGYQANTDMIHIHKGVIKTLDKLKKHGITNAILTRTQKRSVDMVFSRHPELKALIDLVV